MYKDVLVNSTDILLETKSEQKKIPTENYN